MQRSFVLNVALLVFLNLLVKPFYILGVDAAVQNRVGAEEYGFYFALLNLSFLFNILLDLGISNFATRHIAREEKIMQRQFSAMLTLRLALIPVYFLACVLASQLWGMQWSAVQEILLLLCLNQVFVGMIQFMRANLTGLHLFIRDSVVSVLDRLLLIGLCSWALWDWDSFSVLDFVELQTIAYGTTMLLALLMLLGKGASIKIVMDRYYLKEVLEKSLPFALLTLLMMAYTRVDSVMIERMLSNGATEAGIYAQGFRLLDAVNTMTLLFGVILLPMFSRLIHQKKDTTPLAGVAARILLPLPIMIGTIAVFHAEEILGLRYHEHVKASSGPFVFLMLSFMGMSLTHIYGTLLTAAGELRYLNQLALAGLLVNIGLNLLLIPEYGAEGAAVATLCTQVPVSIGHLIRSHVFMGGKANVSLVIRFLILGGALVAGGWWMDEQLDWYVSSGIILVAAPIFTVAAGIIGVGDIRRFVRMYRS